MIYVNSVFSFLLIFFYSSISFSIEPDPEIERRICNDFIELIPEQYAHLSHIGGPVEYYYNKGPWDSHQESCHIDRNTYDYNNIDIILNATKEMDNPRSVHYLYLQAEIRCLFTSEYEWQCLFKNAARFDARYVVLNAGPPFMVHENVFSRDGPEQFLDEAEKQVNKYY